MSQAKNKIQAKNTDLDKCTRNCLECSDLPCNLMKDKFDQHKKYVEIIYYKKGFRKAIEYVDRLYGLLMPVCRIGKNCDHIYELLTHIRMKKVDIPIDVNKKNDGINKKIHDKIRQIFLFILKFVDILQVMTNTTKSFRSEIKFQTNEDIRFYVDIAKELNRVKGLNTPAIIGNIKRDKQMFSAQEDHEFIMDRILKESKTQDGLKDLTGDK